MNRILIDGTTHDGQRLLVIEDMDAGLPYEGRFTVTLDGQPTKVLAASRYRDGGTTTIEVREGRIYWPAERKQQQGRPITFNGEALRG